MVSIILHTVQNLGDHGREIIRIFEIDENITIGSLIEKTLSNIDCKYDHLELRIPSELGPE